MSYTKPFRLDHSRHTRSSHLIDKVESFCDRLHNYSMNNKNSSPTIVAGYNFFDQNMVVLKVVNIVKQALL